MIDLFLAVWVMMLFMYRQLRDLLVFPSVSRPEYLSVFSTHVYQNSIKTGEVNIEIADLLVE
jgi:hypothetical protein